MKFAAGNATRAFTIIALMLVLLLLFWGLGSIPLLSVNEARRAVTSREMLETGQWLLPYMNGDLYLSKPPLFYWLTLMSSQMLGALSEWSLRLPSALFAALCCGLVYWQGVRLAGRQVGLFALIFLAANAGFSLFARRAEIEMTLTGLCFMALLAAWQYLFHEGRRGWVWLSYALLGCALLTKGPVCLLWVTAPVLAFACITRSAKAKAYLCDGWGWLIALAIGSSWYLAVSLQEGWGIWAGILNEDIVKKISGQGAESWYAYLLYLAGDFFPFWLVLLVQPRQLWRSLRARPELMLLFCCSALPLILFSLFTEKHAKYLLPTYPAVALLLAWQWSEVLSRVGNAWHKLMIGLPLVVLAGFTVFYMGFESRAFAHRIAGFPQISSAAAAHPELPAYSLLPPDMRLVYYMGRPVATISAEQALARTEAPGLLFVQAPLPAELNALQPCVLAQVEPYLKPKRRALLIGLGAACPKTPLSVTQ